jgi:hypothetical protein
MDLCTSKDFSPTSGWDALGKKKLPSCRSFCKPEFKKRIPCSISMLPIMITSLFRGKHNKYFVLFWFLLYYLTWQNELFVSEYICIEEEFRKSLTKKKIAYLNNTKVTVSEYFASMKQTLEHNRICKYSNIIDHNSFRWGKYHWD